MLASHDSPDNWLHWVIIVLDFFGSRPCPTLLLLLLTVCLSLLPSVGRLSFFCFCFGFGFGFCFRSCTYTQLPGRWLSCALVAPRSYLCYSLIIICIVCVCISATPNLLPNTVHTLGGLHISVHLHASDRLYLRTPGLLLPRS